MPSQPLITAVICTYDRYEMLETALASLWAQSLAADAFEVLVVDNTPDAAQSAIRGSHHTRPGANFTWHHEPIGGLSNARNTAVRLSQAPLIAFMDDDAIAEPGWLASYCESFATLGEACLAIGGRVRPIWPGERPNWLPDSLLGYISAVDLGPSLRPLQPAEWVAGANIAFRRAALATSGGFDTSLGRIGNASLLSNEEVVLLDRMRSAGGIVGYDPNAIVDHLVEAGRLNQSWFRRRAAWQAVSDRIPSKIADRATVEEQWLALKDYFLRWPPADRTVRALVLDVDDPAQFRWQISAVYDFVACLLNGIGEQDDD